MLWFRLARDLGRTVCELKETISFNEFRMWAAFYVIESERAVPPEQRTRRPLSKSAACHELNRLFGITP